MDHEVEGSDEKGEITTGEGGMAKEVMMDPGEDPGVGQEGGDYDDTEPDRLLLRIQFVENSVDGGRREDRGCEVVAEPDTTARAICR